MTAQERIEGLLNEVGQTIDDLPFFYRNDDRETARQAVRQRMRSGLFVSRNDYLDFICHQSDVIDRMEWALDSLLKRTPKRHECACRLGEMHTEDADECIDSVQPDT